MKRHAHRLRRGLVENLRLAVTAALAVAYSLALVIVLAITIVGALVAAFVPIACAGYIVATAIRAAIWGLP